MGEESDQGVVGARYSAVTWINENKLWLYGGFGFAEERSQGNLQDLWYFNLKNNKWAFVSGEQSADQPYSYPNQCKKFSSMK